MHANLLQLNRVAILLDQADGDLARLDATTTHRADGTIVCVSDGDWHVIDRDGRELSPADYVRDTFGLEAVAA